MTFVTVVLAIRLYTRKWLTKGLGMDDILITLAWVPAMAFGITGIVAEYRFGWNRHVWDIPIPWLVSGVQLG
jgi:hypothetical protein